MANTRKYRFFLLVVATFLFSGSLQAAPQIQHWETRNGARVYFFPAPELPIVDVRVVFDAGSARDGRMYGLASFTNHMLNMGAGGLNATQLAARFEDLGAQVANGIDRDMAWLQLRSLRDEKLLTPAVNTLISLLTRPDFPQADFDREQKRALTGLKLQKQSPGTIAEKAFYQALYGEHPYAHLSSGTEETIAALKRKDVLAFYQRYYVAHNAVIAIVGQMDRKAAEQLAEKLSSGLQPGEAASPLPKVPELKQGRTIRIPFPSTQTHVLIGQPGDYRGDPDYFPLYVGNHALGGSGLVSRLSDEVREKRGLSYSVYSYFLPLSRKGPFMMGMQTRNQQTEEGVRVMMQTLRDYLDKGMTAKELEASRRNITGGFPLRIDSNKKLLEYLAVIGFYKLPLDYLQVFNQRVESVTLQQIHEAMKRRLRPERMVTVIVGGGQ